MLGQGKGYALGSTIVRPISVPFDAMGAEVVDDVPGSFFRRFFLGCGSVCPVGPPFAEACFSPLSVFFFFFFFFLGTSSLPILPVIAIDLDSADDARF